MSQQSRVSEPPSSSWSHLPPQDPHPDLEWGSELPGSGHGAFARTSQFSSPPGLSLEQSLPSLGPGVSGCTQASGGRPWDPGKGLKWEGAEATLQGLTSQGPCVCVCCPGAEGWRTRSMGGPEHPAQWSPRGLLLDPEGKEELTAPGTCLHRQGQGCPRPFPVAAIPDHHQLSG